MTARGRPACTRPTGVWKKRLSTVAHRHRPSAPEPPSPPFVQVVHPATASTQIVLADTFQTAPPGRQTYRPLQYLTQNGYPETPGANVTNAMIDANIVLCAQGECTKLICATSCDESIGKISPECKSITWIPSLQACDYHADNHTAPAGFDDMGREYYVSSPAEEGYINVQLTITDPEHLNVMVDANGNRGAMRPIFVMDAEPNAHGGALAWRGTFTTGGILATMPIGVALRESPTTPSTTLKWAAGTRTARATRPLATTTHTTSQGTWLPRGFTILESVPPATRTGLLATSTISTPTSAGRRTLSSTNSTKTP